MAFFNYYTKISNFYNNIQGVLKTKNIMTKRQINKGFGI